MSKDILPMRDSFFNALYDIARKDKRVILVTADCGAPSLDKFREDLRSQYFTVGIAEQNMISIAAGLALEGKIVYTYAIAPFASLRCYEQIKVDLCCMNLPVTSLGIGAGLAYDIMGPTHHTTEDISIMRALPNMTILNPSDSVMSGDFAKVSYEAAGPKYIRFDRGDLPLLYADRKIDYSKGLVELKKGSGLCIIATGVMVHKAIEISEELSQYSINPGVIDVYRMKPMNEKLLLQIMSKYEHVVSLEEHFRIGGLGSALSEIICDNEKNTRLMRFGICDKYYFEYGGRDRLHSLCRLDKKSVLGTIVSWVNAKDAVMARGR